MTRFFETLDDEHAQPHTVRFTYRRAAFSNTLKSKAGLMVARAAALRININTDGCVINTDGRVTGSHINTDGRVTGSSRLKWTRTGTSAKMGC